jgi:hypothetical protein
MAILAVLSPQTSPSVNGRASLGLFQSRNVIFLSSRASVASKNFYAAIARLVLGYDNELQDLVHATGQPAVGNVVPMKRPLFSVAQRRN